MAGIAGLLLAALIVLLAAGCDGDSGSAATGGSTQPIDSITVSGEGVITAGPDEATLNITVETEGTEATQALDENSKRMEQVLERLKQEGLDEESLQTASVVVYPNRTWNPESGQETLIGYRAQNSIRVTLTDLTIVGDIFSAAAEAGANNISGPEWRLADDSAAVSESLGKAFAVALAKAEALAKAAGVKVGDVLAIQESSTTIPPIAYETRAAADSLESIKSVPMNPMDLEVRGSVTVTFRLSR